MNPFQNKIEKHLRDEKLTASMEKLVEENPNFKVNISSYTIKMDKTLRDFYYVKEILLESINNGVFKNLPVPLQHSFSQGVESLYNQRANPSQFSVSVQNIFHQIVVGGLELKVQNLDQFREILMDVAGLKGEYLGALKDFKRVTDQLEEIRKFHQVAQLNAKEIAEKYDDSIQIVDSTIKGLRRIEEMEEIARKKEQIVENAKKEILAFKENVDSFKQDIAVSSDSAEKILNDFEKKRNQVELLIKESEEALKLKASEGMSAAFSKQYEEEGKIMKRRQWLIAAGVFFTLTLVGLTLLIFQVPLGGWDVDPTSLNAVVARSIFVGVTVAGASFATKQYLSQKRLADVYAYKLVLAQSIVAFAQEIKKHDKEKAGEYMTNVLNELNRSPLTRESSGQISKSNIHTLERLKELLHSH